MKGPEEEYIGDAVYASFDGYHIVLRTGDGNNMRIALEPTVWANLKGYANKINETYNVQAY